MKKILISAMVLSAALGVVPVAHADTVENLERERAHLVATFLNPSLSPADRQRKVELAKPRLVDMERMVLRDDSLKGRNTPTIRKAFANYDLTFLVHASTEKNLSLVDHWLDQMGLTTEAVMSSRIGYR